MNKINYYVYRLCQYMMLSTVCTLAILGCVTYLHALSFHKLGFSEYATAITGGLLLGLAIQFGMKLGIKLVMQCAEDIVMRANAASAQLNAKRAQALGHRLKLESQQQIQACIMMHARVIIAQMNGEQDARELASFFEHKMPFLTEEAQYKIDRHFNYLTDRAIHGDMQALKRLYQLYRRHPVEREKEIASLIDQMINVSQEIEKLKDKIDTLYDQWKFRRDARAYVDDEPFF